MADGKYRRYQRQIALKEIGQEGQDRLWKAKVVVVGAGGLGCAALQYLTAAGVGNLGIVDEDFVSESNLHRQVLYIMEDIGFPKAYRATLRLNRLNPGIKINPYFLRLTTDNVLDIFSAYDIVIDGTDNIMSRYLINDACVFLGKTLVYGAVSRFEGQVAIFGCKSSQDVKPVNYRDLFPSPPQYEETMNCEEAGVLGVLPGIIGIMQANETIKLIIGIGKPLINRLLTYNALTNDIYEIHLSPTVPQSYSFPKTANEFRHMDYTLLSNPNCPLGLQVDEFDGFLKDKMAIIIDVREEEEMPIISEFPHLHIPWTKLQQKIPILEGENIITFCQSGGRSKQAAKLLSDALGGSVKVYFLSGGILNWSRRKKQF